jgi:hypothetical protein
MQVITAIENVRVNKYDKPVDGDIKMLGIEIKN